MPGVLVVDDDRAIREMLSGVLTTESYTVQIAECGGAALDILRVSRDCLVARSAW